MPASDKKKPGPEEPGHPGHPPQSVGTHADNHLNQPIAGAGPIHSTAPDVALAQFRLPDQDDCKVALAGVEIRQQRSGEV